jgi:DNA primase
VISIRLHPDTTEAVKQRADIVDIVSEHVVLKRQGKDLVGFCPFHDDKNNPSFTVSPSKQFYYCFSCEAGGDGISFLMEIGKSSFTDVVLDLAQRYDVPIRTLEPEKRQEIERQLSRRENLYEVLALAATLYEHSMHQPHGAIALDYLQRDRRLSDTVIQRFQLGYAPAGWTPLLDYLVGQKGYPVELVEAAGLIIKRKSGGGYYDRFRNRLMIPVRDIQGRIIGFGARSLTGETPKYLNSPDTDLFDKGQILFGLDQARPAIVKQDRAIVVEGYFDVIALHAAGITNAVAAQGTALSQAQIRSLLRYTESKRLVLNFDADRAGVQAAERAIGEVEKLACQGQIELHLLSLPEGKDPDEFLRQSSPGQYLELAEQAPMWIEWRIQQLIGDRDLKRADIFQSVIQRLVKFLGTLPNAAVRTHYIHRCAELLGQGELRLSIRLEDDLRQQVRGQRWHGRGKKWERPGHHSARGVAEAQLLQIYLHCPNDRLEVRRNVWASDIEFTMGAHRLIWRQILAFEVAHLGTEAAEAVDRLTREDLAAIDQLSLLQGCIGEVPQEAMTAFLAILELDEKSAIDIRRPPLVIKAAVATLERIEVDKRSRHLLDSWAGQATATLEQCLEKLLEPGADPYEDGRDQIEQVYNDLNAESIRILNLYYEERGYLALLDRQRCATIGDIREYEIQTDKQQRGLLK